MTAASPLTRRLAAAVVFGCIAALTAAFTAPSGTATPPASPAAGARHRASLLTQAPPRAAAAAMSPLPGLRARPRPVAATGEQLVHVSATSADNAWATGGTVTTPGKSVVLHWNGKIWSPVAIPHPTVNDVGDVSAVSARNAWLVGVHCPNRCATETTLIMRWNGTAWSRVASPNVAGKANFLSAVSASSAGNAWAAGSACSTTTGSCVLLMLHWNGTRWSKVASPAPGVSDRLQAVTTISASDAWAAGWYCSPGCHAPLVMHWNGTRWSKAAVPPVGFGGLFGLAATSAGDVWAVGDAHPMASFKTVIFHWNGTKWSRVTSPDPGSNDALSGVAATSASDAWAVGQTCTTTGCAISHTLIAHWNGKTWSRVPSPSPGPGSTLAGVAATSSSNAWAVGSNCNNTQCAPIMLHWNGTAWVKA